MKKILSLILVLAMTFSLSTTALAADSTTSSISENEAVELARWFIANDIYENGNNGWSESTVIDSVTTDSGFYGSSYIVKLIIWQKIFGNIMDTLEQQITISFSMV